MSLQLDGKRQLECNFGTTPKASGLRPRGVALLRYNPE